jgi:uncharacterized protein (TIGR04141 family)
MANPPLTSTRQFTLYRLLGVEPNLEAIADAFETKIEKLESEGGRWEILDIAGCPALVMFGSHQGPPGWLPEAESLTGRTYDFPDHRSFILIVLAVDGHAYALGFGVGHHRIPLHYKDARFGLSLAIRVADIDRVKDMVRRRPGHGGRVDSTQSADGMPFWMIPFNQQQDLVSRFGAHAEDLNLTAGRGGFRRVLVDGGTGLKTRFGTRPESLVADIREIAATIEQKAPIPELAFIEHVVSVQDPELQESLDEELDGLLASVAAGRDEIELAVPPDCAEHFERTHAAEIRIGTVAKPIAEITVEEILHRTSVQPRGTRVEALRRGKVKQFADYDRTELLAQSCAAKWIEATVSRASHRYHFIDGMWLEIDSEYADAHNTLIEDLMTDPNAITLPPWQHGWIEPDYLQYAAARTGMLLLDRKYVRPAGGGTIEICDLLGPDNELIHVKQAKGSDALSHLFNQGIVSARALYTSEDVRSKFAKLVADEGGEGRVPDDFVPKKVVFAIRHSGGRPLSVETLFAFSKVALADTVKRLRDMSIEVQVTFIDTVAL